MPGRCEGQQRQCRAWDEDFGDADSDDQQRQCVVWDATTESWLQHQVVLFLCGTDVPAWASACRGLRGLLWDEDIWGILFNQEFLSLVDAVPSVGKESNALRYRRGHAIDNCDSIRWHLLDYQNGPGAREGSPGMFSLRGFLFLFGGWGQALEDDLHAARLDSSPLVFRQLWVEGDGPPASFDRRVTVLEEREQSRPSQEPRSSTVVVAMSGGYMLQGNRNESPCCGLMEITFPPTSSDGNFPTARWQRIVRMTPRANHSATYIPPRLAGPMYEQGFLLIFGGNTAGRISNSIDILDLKTFECEMSAPSFGEKPEARNSHSAALLPTSDGECVVIAGGGQGDDRNGGGGRDVGSIAWLHPKDLHWERPRQSCDKGISWHSAACGRGHSAFRLGDNWLMFSGGLAPRRRMIKLGKCSYRAKQRLMPYGTDRLPSLVSISKIEALGEVLPEPRSSGGCCSLPDGTLLVYGGWNEETGQLGDLWAGHVAGFPTRLVKSLFSNTDLDLEALDVEFQRTAGILRATGEEVEAADTVVEDLW